MGRLHSLRKWLQWLVVCVCVGYLVHFFFSYPEQLASIRQLRTSTLLWASLLMIVYFSVYSLRYQVLLESVVKRRLSFRYLFSLMVFSRFLNQTAPQLGNAYRGVRLRQDCGVPYTDCLASFVAFAWLDTLFDLVVAVVLCAAAGAGSLKLGAVPVFATLAGMLGAMLLVPPLGIALVKRLPTPWPWLENRVGRVIRLGGALLRDSSALGKFALFSLMGLVSMALVFWILFDSVGTPISAWQVSLFYALYRMTMLLMVTPGSLGVREVASGGLGEVLGVGLGASVAVTVVARVLGLVVLAFVAMSWKLYALATARAPSSAAAGRRKC